MRPFLVCIHDVTPAYARETQLLMDALAPLIGRCYSVGVVPNWHGEWPLAAHGDYCQRVKERAEELLLHGYLHRRHRGAGPVSWLAECSDEMNGLDVEATRRVIDRGQRVFTDVFGEHARGFLAPAWQQGQVARSGGRRFGMEHVLGFFSLESGAGTTIPLATFSWDCGRRGALGHVGHGVGWLLHALRHGVPTLAIHPRDLERGFWPKILRLIRALLQAGHEPATPSGLLRDAQVAL